MKKLKSILVVFNGTETGHGALRQALKLASRGHCDVAVAVVLPSTTGKPVLVGVREVRESMSRAVVGAVSAVKPKLEAAEPQMRTILEGKVDEAIIKVAKERDCDLIIIGRGLKDTAGATAKSFMETVTAKVIGTSPIDVLVMPRGVELRWDNILLAIDGSSCSDVATTKALTLSREFGSFVNVLSVVNLPAETYGEAPREFDRLVDKAKVFVDNTRARALSFHVPSAGYVREGDPHEKIVEIADTVSADVVFMGTYGRTGLRKFFMGSVTEDVITKSSCPVYVAKSC